MYIQEMNTCLWDFNLSEAPTAPSVPSQDNERLYVYTRNAYMFMRFQFIRGSDCPSVPSQDNERLNVYTRNEYMFMRFQFIRGSDCPQCTKSGQ